MMTIKQIKENLERIDNAIKVNSEEGNLTKVLMLLNAERHLKNSLIDRLESNYFDRNPHGRVIVKKGA